MKLLIMLSAIFIVFPVFAKDFYIFAENEIEPEQKIFYLVKKQHFVPFPVAGWFVR